MLITGIGLTVSSILPLHALKIGGRLTHCVAAWKAITENNWVRNVVRFGYKIPLLSKPFQSKIPPNPSTTGDAYDVLVEEALGLLKKGAIKEVADTENQFISSYFAVPKPRSTKWRPILNLKYFNENVKHFGFKMETFKQVRDWIQPNSYLIGLDLKDQFLSVPMNQGYRKFLRFKWLGKLYEWCVLPFGLKCSPRVVTKLLKPVIALLRSLWNILISIYMDDMIIQADTPEKAYFDAQVTILLLLCLGWEINFEKSTLIPTQNLTHLGFEMCTKTMTAKCPQKKIDILVEAANKALGDGYLTVHNAEKLMGLMESVRPVTPLAALKYRSLQMQLLNAKSLHRIPNQIINLSTKSKSDLAWWVSNSGFAISCTAPLREANPTVHIWSDASMVGAGAHNSRGEFRQRFWSENELLKEPHINFLEIKAAKEAVFELAIPGDKIRMHIDSCMCIHIEARGHQE